MNSCGIPKDNGVRRHVSGNHAACAYDGIFPNRDVRQDRASRPDRSAFLHERLFDLPVCFGLELAAVCGSAGIDVIDESDVVANKNVVFDVYAFTYKGVAGNLAALADFCVLLDFDERADLRLVADFAAVQVDEFGKLDVLAELHTRSD